jgi:hypothetical protein
MANTIHGCYYWQSLIQTLPLQFADKWKNLLHSTNSREKWEYKEWISLSAMYGSNTTYDSVTKRDILYNILTEFWI